MNELERQPNREALAPKRQHTVFISYASEDRSIAIAICAALEAEGTGCWIAPRNLQGGWPYSGQITQAIRESRVLLFVLSRASSRSKQVLREAERAAHCQNHLLTFRIERILPGDDLAYFLGAEHWVDGFRPLPPSEHFPRLIQHARASASEQGVGINFRNGPGCEGALDFRPLSDPPAVGRVDRSPW
jgi:hypothetical protein